MPGRQFPDTAKERVGAGNVTQRQIIAHCAEVYFGPNVDGGKERLDLGREYEPALAFAIVERLHPDAIAHDQKPGRVLPSIDDCDGKHAVQSRPSLGPPFEIGGQQPFGIRLRLEAVTVQTKLVAKLAKIIYLPV